MKCAAANKRIREDRKTQRIKEESMHQVIDTVLTVLVYVLVDKYGYGNQKACQVIKTIERVFEEVCEDYVKVDELAGILKDEYNLELGFLHGRSEKK